MELHWWSIEVFNTPEHSARAWREAHGASLVEAAITNGAYDWAWRVCDWGVVFEIGFRSDERWPVYRDLPAVRAALDAVPDPARGVIVYPGRGGSSATAEPRRPRPVLGAGGAEIRREEFVRIALPDDAAPIVTAGPPGAPLIAA